MMSSAWDNRGTIANVASHIAPLFLAGEGSSPQETEPMAIKVDYVISLQRLAAGVRTVSL